MPKDGTVEKHFLKCPYCKDGRASQIDHRCFNCGALAVKVVWESGTPELAMIGKK